MCPTSPVRAASTRAPSASKTGCSHPPYANPPPPILVRPARRRHDAVERYERAEILHAFDQEGRDAAQRCILNHLSTAWVTELMSKEGGSTMIGRGNTMIGPLARYVEAGDLDKAFELLQGALAERDPGLVHLAVAPHGDKMRDDPRFNQCLARMKLPSVL
jgi:hypothetical protein